MTTIKIDNIDYDTDKLSDEAKAQLISLQFCDQELARMMVNDYPANATAQASLQRVLEHGEKHA